MKSLYLRLKFGIGIYKTDYKLFKTENQFILYKGYYISKRGTLEELKDYLRKIYHSYYIELQKRISKLIGEPYICKIPEISLLLKGAR